MPEHPGDPACQLTIGLGLSRNSYAAAELPSLENSKSIAASTDRALTDRVLSFVGTCCRLSISCRMSPLAASGRPLALHHRPAILALLYAASQHGVAGCNSTQTLFREEGCNAFPQ